MAGRERPCEAFPRRGCGGFLLRHAMKGRCARGRPSRSKGVSLVRQRRGRPGLGIRRLHVPRQPVSRRGAVDRGSASRVVREAGQCPAAGRLLGAAGAGFSGTEASSGAAVRPCRPRTRSSLAAFRVLFPRGASGRARYGSAGGRRTARKLVGVFLSRVRQPVRPVQRSS